MEAAAEVKIEKAERRNESNEIVVEAVAEPHDGNASAHLAESMPTAPPVANSEDEEVPLQMAGPPTEVTLNGISNFLAEHHTYLAQNTMAMIAAMRAELFEESERRLREQEQAHAWTLAENQATIAEQQRQLAIAQHSLERLIGDRESAGRANAKRFYESRRTLRKKTILHAWHKEAFRNKAERLLTHVLKKSYEKSLAKKALSAWIKFVFGSRENRHARNAEKQLKAVTSEIISRYESELDKKRTHIDSLKAALLEGRRRQSVLKDELRRTLLKGMVTMNMEALTIFSQDDEHQDLTTSDLTLGRDNKTDAEQTTTTTRAGTFNKKDPLSFPADDDDDAQPYAPLPLPRTTAPRPSARGPSSRT